MKNICLEKGSCFSINTVGLNFDAIRLISSKGGSRASCVLPRFIAFGGLTDGMPSLKCITGWKKGKKGKFSFAETLTLAPDDEH